MLKLETWKTFDLFIYYMYYYRQKGQFQQDIWHQPSDFPERAVEIFRTKTLPFGGRLKSGSGCLKMMGKNEVFREPSSWERCEIGGPTAPEHQLDCSPRHEVKHSVLAISLRSKYWTSAGVYGVNDVSEGREFFLHVLWKMPVFLSQLC